MSTIGLAVCLGIAAGLLLPTGAAYAQQKLRFAHVYETTEAYHKWAVWAADEVKKRTNGRYQIDVFPASSLGKEEDIFAGLALGTINMSYTGSFYAASRFGPMAISSAPYMFRDQAHWLAYRDSPMFQELADGFHKTTGQKVLGLVYYGERHVTSNKPIRTPEDMKGMKLRVPNSPMYMLLPKAVGANPAPIAFAEVYLALQQGTVDGQENPLPTIRAKKFYEVQKYIALTGHLIDSLLILVGGPTWTKLSPADQEIFQAVYREAAARCTDEIRAEEAKLAAEMEKSFGVTVMQVDRDAFRKAMAPMLTQAGLPWSPEHYERVQAIR